MPGFLKYLNNSLLLRRFIIILKIVGILSIYLSGPFLGFAERPIFGVGAVVGIAVGCLLGGMLLVGAVTLLILRCRSAKKKEHGIGKNKCSIYPRLLSSIVHKGA